MEDLHCLALSGWIAQPNLLELQELWLPARAGWELRRLVWSANSTPPPLPAAAHLNLQQLCVLRIKIHLALERRVHLQTQVLV